MSGLVAHLLSLPGSWAYAAIAVLVFAEAAVFVGFEVGRRLGPKIVDLRILRRHRARLESAQTYLRQRGGRAVLLGRFTAFLRAVIPGLAGASRMPYKRFLTFNILGGAVWGTGVAVLGYLAGSSFDTVARSLGQSSAGLLAVLLLTVLVTWDRRRRRLRASATPDDGAHTPPLETVPR